MSMRAYGSCKKPGVGWFFDYYPAGSKYRRRALKKRARQVARRQQHAEQ